MTTIFSDYKHNTPVKSFFILLTGFYFILTGCNKADSDIDNSDYASVSIYAAVPDAPELNFFLNGANVAVGVPYASYTLYNRVNPGTVNFNMQSFSRVITADTTFTVAQNRYYSMFITGTPTAIKPVILHDSFPSPETGYCGLRFFVFASGVPGIDLHMALAGDTTGSKTGWINRTYNDNIVADSINRFKKFAQGTYSFYAINKANSNDTIAKLGNKTFSDSSNYTLMLTGHLTLTDTALFLGSRLH